MFFEAVCFLYVWKILIHARNAFLGAGMENRYFFFFCFTHISCGNVQGRVIILWSSGLRCFSIKLGGRNEKNHSPLHYKSNGRSTNVSGGAPLNNLNIEIHSICTYPIVHELAYLFKHQLLPWQWVVLRVVCVIIVCRSSLCSCWIWLSLFTVGVFSLSKM